MAERPGKGNQAGVPAGRPESLFTSPLSLLAAESILARRRPEDFRWRYEDGLALYAVAEAGRRHGRHDLLSSVSAVYESLVAPDGAIAGFRREDYNLDQINPGRLLFDLGRERGDPRYARAIDTLRAQLEAQPRCVSGGFWHKGLYPNQMWLDGLYMAEPFYLRSALEGGDAEAVADVLLQFRLAESVCRDEATGLLHHAWDESRRQAWADPASGKSPNFWGRAMGWLAMALVDCLALLPPGHQGAEALNGALRRLLTALLRFADPETGLWWQIVDKGSSPGNYLEISASSMFIYALARGLNLGLLSGEAFGSAAAKAWTSLVKGFVTRDEKGLFSLGGICAVAGLGGSPYRDGSYRYYLSEPVVSDDFKGVGPFILAALEMERQVPPS